MEKEKLNKLKFAASRILQSVTKKLLFSMLEGKPQEETQKEVIEEYGEVVGPILITAAVLLINTNQEQINEDIDEAIAKFKLMQEADGVNLEDINSVEDLLNDDNN